jgi:hypothetical protein
MVSALERALDPRAFRHRSFTGVGELSRLAVACAAVAVSRGFRS